MQVEGEESVIVSVGSGLPLTHTEERAEAERWSSSCGLGGHTAGLTSVFLPQRPSLQMHEHGKMQTCFQGRWESLNNPGMDLF